MEAQIVKALHSWQKKPRLILQGWWKLGLRKPFIVGEEQVNYKADGMNNIHCMLKLQKPLPSLIFSGDNVGTESW